MGSGPYGEYVCSIYLSKVCGKGIKSRSNDGVCLSRSYRIEEVEVIYCTNSPLRDCFRRTRMGLTGVVHGSPYGT